MTTFESRPVWEQVDLIKKTIDTECLTPELPDDIHQIRLGSQEALKASALDIFWTIKRMCHYSRSSEWTKLWPLINYLVNNFFSSEDYALGLYEVCARRKTPTARQRPEGIIFSEETREQPDYTFPCYRLKRRRVEVAGLQLPGDLLRMAYSDGASTRGVRWTQAAVRKTLGGQANTIWNEYKYFLANRDNDDGAIRQQNIIPAVHAMTPEGSTERLTPMFSLTRFHRNWSFGPLTRVRVLTVELHPESAQILSIRDIPQVIGGLAYAAPDVDRLIRQALLDAY